MKPEEVEALLADLAAYRKRLLAKGKSHAAASVGYAALLVRRHRDASRKRIVQQLAVQEGALRSSAPP